MHATPALTVTGLTKRYGSHDAVSDLSFSIPADKATTIRMLLGLIRPTAGAALVDGKPFEDLADPASKVGVLIEGAQAHPGRTAHAHLRILAAERSIEPSRIDETLDVVHLADARNDKVRSFSARDAAASRSRCRTSR